MIEDSGEVAQETRAPSALPKVLGLIPAYNLLELQFQGIRHPLLASVGTACMWCTYIQAGKNTDTHETFLRRMPLFKER